MTYGSGDHEYVIDEKGVERRGIDKLTPKAKAWLGTLVVGSVIAAGAGFVYLVEKGAPEMTDTEQLIHDLERAEETCLSFGSSDCATKGDLVDNFSQYAPEDIDCRLLVPSQGMLESFSESKYQYISSLGNPEFKCSLKLDQVAG